MNITIYEFKTFVLQFHYEPVTFGKFVTLALEIALKTLDTGVHFCTSVCLKTANTHKDQHHTSTCNNMTVV